jgi:hypothetical protein
MRAFCDPVIAVAWNDKWLLKELENDGFEVHVIPEHRREVEYNDVRRKIDIWFNFFQLKSPSRRIQRRYLDQYVRWSGIALRKAREAYNIAKLYAPFYKESLFRTEERLLHTSTNLNELCRFVEDLRIDAVFTVTPFHRQEDILLRACKLMGKKMMTSILSFDNITKRGWIPVEYDLYIVWNEQNKEQLHRIYPFTRQKLVYICGPAQFDFYFDRNYLMEQCEWKRLNGIGETDHRKIILYAGGPAELFPHEPHYLKEIDQSISKGIIKNRPYILFRCHPMDNMERWKAALGDSENVIFENSWNGSGTPGYANVTDADIRKLCSTLAYTDVHVNLCSTMSIDGSAFGKPQIGPAYAPDKSGHSGKLLYNMYLQEHFHPVVKTGGLKIAHSSTELMQMVNDALENDVCSEKNREILKDIITYSDGKCTERVSAVIENFLAQ